MAVLALGCNKSDNGPTNGLNGPNVDADYSVLLTADGILSEALLNANAEVITLNPATSAFESTSVPELSFREGTVLSFYNEKSNCTGEITSFDFSDYSFKKLGVFDDIQSCQIEVRSITHSGTAIYLVYGIPGSGAKKTHYFIRMVDVASSGATFTETELDKEPRQIIFSNNRVFILSLDPEEEEEENALVVYNTASGELVHDLDLDSDVQMIFKTVDGNIMVSYPDLHLIINSITLGITDTVRYNDGKEPKFGTTKAAYFDTGGNLYYPMPTGLSGTEYPNIPGVYDFSTNTAVLYFYENFLTAEERNFEFEIGDTSIVTYDAGNNLILIGYKKDGNANKGGILRIKPIPEPKFIDNIDLNGVPFEIFVN